VKLGALASVNALALLVGGCPHRSATRVTYVPPAPPPAAEARPTASGAPGGTLVIEEPPPPEPSAPVAPAQATSAPPEPAPRRRRAQAQPEKPDESSPAPALEAIPNLQQQNNELEAQQKALTKRIDDADRLDLDPRDRQALEDARGFLAQSLRALGEGDADRSLKLAKKASLLLDAVEQAR